MSTTPDPKADLYALELTGATRRKSPLSTDNGDCVEIEDLPGGGVAVFDSKRPDRTDLRFTKAEWHAFKEGIRQGLL
ncbi:DUF397 domain-containing protein [Kitasatospora sp. NPDC059973]|uniref:DUF397 domain-containing protein n=1 Tax=Kitasatospora sp. NPDC059973 TaxID=3347020 RepID=UPI0036BB1E7C